MLTNLGYIDGKCYHDHTIHTDPMGYDIRNLDMSSEMSSDVSEKQCVLSVFFLMNVQVINQEISKNMFMILCIYIYIRTYVYIYIYTLIYVYKRNKDEMKLRRGAKSTCLAFVECTCLTLVVETLTSACFQ